jgi:hypothetical protein
VTEAVRRFATLSRTHHTETAAIAPRRALFDAKGLGETGDPVVHEAVAAATFALTRDGEVSGPVKLGDAGDLAIVQRVALRPAMKLAEVPPPELERARNGLRAARANALMKAKAAELRAGVTVAVAAESFADLRATPGKGRFLRPGPFSGRPTLGKGITDLKAVMKDPPGSELRRVTPEAVLEEVRKGQARKGEQP